MKTEEKLPLGVVLATLVHDNKILLIRREKGYYIGLWSLLGGKIESNEHISEAAVREVREESGIHCEFIEHLGSVSEHLIENKEVEQHFLLHVCKLKPKTANMLVMPETYEGKLEWFELEKLDESKHLIIPSDYLMIKKMLLNKEKNYYNCIIERIGKDHILRKFE
jgi:8-oxo-dGTP diphosphatase